MGDLTFRVQCHGQPGQLAIHEKYSVSGNLAFNTLLTSKRTFVFPNQNSPVHFTSYVRDHLRACAIQMALERR